MAKTFPIRIEVEEIALGSVLRRLNEMAGVAKIDLDLGHGGKKPLPQPASVQGNGNGVLGSAVAMLISGEKTISEISAVIGGARSRVYGLLHQLKGKKLIKQLGKGRYCLTDKAMAELTGQTQIVTPVAPLVPALPSPVKHGSKGRAAPGSGNIVLRLALNGGPLGSSDLRSHMAGKGMSTKSISGVLDRAKRDGLVKLNGNKAYELTAKGQKIELQAEAAHG
jgi:hypothetical protein